MSTDSPQAGAEMTATDIALHHGAWRDLNDASKAWNELLDYAQATESALTAARLDIERHKEDAAAVRELMNVYNLGGWTDAVEPMKRALAAEAELAAMREAFEPLLRYPGLREYVGTILFDAATAAIAKERT